MYCTYTHVDTHLYIWIKPYFPPPHDHILSFTVVYVLLGYNAVTQIGCCPFIPAKIAGNPFNVFHIKYIPHCCRYMSEMYITGIAGCRGPTSSWHHTNCCTLVGLHHQCGGRLPHNKTLLQEDISKEFSFKR